MSGVLWAYLLMAVLPTLLLAAMFLLGLDHDMDVDIDTDVDLDVGDVDVGMGDLPDGDIGMSPGMLGMKLVLSFIGGFGVFGFLAKTYDWVVPHPLAGALGGVAFYFVMYRLLKVLYNQQANSITRSSSLIGTEALVVTHIRKGGVGEIKAEMPTTGSSVHLSARSVDPDREYGNGDVVKIQSIITGLARVIPAEDIQKEKGV